MSTKVKFMVRTQKFWKLKSGQASSRQAALLEVTENI